MKAFTKLALLSFTLLFVFFDGTSLGQKKEHWGVETSLKTAKLSAAHWIPQVNPIPKNAISIKSKFKRGKPINPSRGGVGEALLGTMGKATPLELEPIETVQICRGNYQGKHYVGRLRNNSCYIISGAKEVSVKSYEILVGNGKFLDKKVDPLIKDYESAFNAVEPPRSLYLCQAIKVTNDIVFEVPGEVIDDKCMAAIDGKVEIFDDFRVFYDFPLEYKEIVFTDWESTASRGILFDDSTTCRGIRGIRYIFFNKGIVIRENLFTKPSGFVGEKVVKGRYRGRYKKYDNTLFIRFEDEDVRGTFNGNSLSLETSNPKVLVNKENGNICVIKPKFTMFDVY